MTRYPKVLITILAMGVFLAACQQAPGGGGEMKAVEAPPLVEEMGAAAAGGGSNGGIVSAPSDTSPLGGIIHDETIFKPPTVVLPSEPMTNVVLPLPPSLGSVVTTIPNSQPPAIDPGSSGSSTVPDNPGQQEDPSKAPPQIKSIGSLGEPDLNGAEIKIDPAQMQKIIEALKQAKPQTPPPSNPIQ